MKMPDQLRAAIEQETAKVERRALARAVAELTQSYKSGIPSLPAIRSEVHRAAYLATRLPATYAACFRVLSEVRQLAPQVEVSSLLDLGAGPATALWAAAETFPGLAKATLVESDAAMLQLGKRLSAESETPSFRHAQWKTGDLTRAEKYPRHDLVVVSYVLGELTASGAQALVAEAWSAAAEFLVIVEPGTPRGFSAVNAARTALIAAGAQILAPCPNQLACPMAAAPTPARAKPARPGDPASTPARAKPARPGDPAGDWCHFSQRVERTSLHRQLKNGALAYEDEKFSYLVASRHSGSSGLARIVRHPRKNPGHVQLTLCSGGRIEQRTITRSQREAYKLARQAEWGETWNDQPLRV